MYRIMQKYRKLIYREPELYLLLLIGGLYSIGLFLSNTFVNIYLWRQTESFQTVASYHLAIAVSKPLTFMIAGKISKKLDRILLLRLGILFLSIFFLMVLLLGEITYRYTVFLGLIIGIGYGLYWLAFNVLTFEITEPYNRLFFNGALGCLQSLSGMIGPFLSGLLISRLETNTGYMLIFSLSFILFLLAIFVSFFISRRTTDGNYRLVTAWHYVKKNRNLMKIYLANFFQGMRDGVFVFVIVIWIFITTQDEYFIGMFNLLLNTSSFLVFIALTFLITEFNRPGLIRMSSIPIAFAVWILLGELSFPKIILYALTIGLTMPMLQVPFQALTYDAIGKAKEARDLRIEYLVLLEIWSNLGSVFAIMLFILLISITSLSNPIAISLCILSLSYLWIYPLLPAYSKKGKL